MLSSNYFINTEIINVPFNRLLAQPCNFNNAPTVFNGLPIHSELLNHQKSFIVGILNEAARTATTTPGRAYHWNAFCSNNFCNSELMNTVILAANYTAIGIAKNTYRDIESAANASIPYVIEVRGAYIAAVSPELLRQYPDNIQQKIRRAAQEYVDVANEVTNYINNVVYRNNNSFGNNTNNGFSNTFNNSNNNSNNSFGNSNNSFGNSNNSFGNSNNSFGNNNNSGFGSRSDSSGFNTARNNAVNNVKNNRDPFTTTNTVNSTSNSIFNTGNTISNNNRGKINDLLKAKVTNDVPVDAVIKTVETLPDFNAKTEWSPSKVQSFPIACSLTKSKRLLEKTNDGIIYTIKNKSEEEIKMERNAHKTGSTEIAVSRGTQYSVKNKSINNRSDYLKTSLTILSETHEKAFHADEETFTQNLNTYYLNGYSVLNESETSLDAAINTTRQLKVLTTDLNQLGAHRADFDLDKMFVIPKDEIEEFEKLLKVTNLAQLAAKLKAALLDEERSLAYNSALIQLDSYIKKNLLNMVQYELGLTEYTGIGSFVDDFADLEDAIKSDGDFYYAAFKKNERSFITRYLTLSNTVEVVGDGNNQLINASLKVRSSLTVVDFLYQEMDLNLVPNVSNTVIKTEFPMIYDFLDELISNDYIKDGEVYYGNHWLVTADDVVLRIYCSLLDGRTILISKQ